MVIALWKHILEYLVIYLSCRDGTLCSGLTRLLDFHKPKWVESTWLNFMSFIKCPRQTHQIRNGSASYLVRYVTRRKCSAITYISPSTDRPVPGVGVFIHDKAAVFFSVNTSFAQPSLHVPSARPNLALLYTPLSALDSDFPSKHYTQLSIVAHTP